MIEFTIPGEPASKARARFTKYGSKVHTYTPAKTRQAEVQVAKAYLAVAERGTDTSAAYGVTVEFLHQTGQRRDVDNMLKLILDGLNKIAWPDDVQVTHVSASKRRVPKGEAETRVSIKHLGRIDRPRGRCLHCGGEFDYYASQSARKFCSQRCHLEHRKANRVRACTHCGEEFLAHGVSRKTEFCGLECNSANKRVTLACVTCGTPFTKPRSLANKGIAACSDECRATYHRLSRAVRAAGTCDGCGGANSRKTAKLCRSCHLFGPDNRREYPNGAPRVTVTITPLESF